MDFERKLGISSANPGFRAQSRDFEHKPKNIERNFKLAIQNKKRGSILGTSSTKLKAH